jgi:hypothetical protein
MLKVLLPGTVTINQLITGRSQDNLGEIFGVFVSRSVEEFGIEQKLSQFGQLSWGIIGFEILTLALIYGLTLYAILFCRACSWKWLFALTILYLVLVAGPAGAPRFRVAIMPILSLIAAVGAISIHEARQQVSNRGTSGTRAVY